MRAVALLILASLVFSAAGAAKTPVPAKYRPLHDQLDTTLDRLERALPPPRRSVAVGGELLAANSNAGPALLRPTALQTVEVMLDAMKKLGADGVTVSIGYPILSPEYPDSPRYAAFYERVAELVRERRLTLMVELNVLFANTPFSPIDWDFTGLTLDRYVEAKAAMARTVLERMAPDYLSLEEEADTGDKLSGLPLDDPATYADVVRRELALIGNPPRTKLGAGVGTWSSLDFSRKLAALPDVDFVNTHVYPLNPRFVQNAVAIAQIAREHGKAATIGELWLYKSTRPGIGGPAGVDGEVANTRANVYSFWAPLDGRFLNAMYDLAAAAGYEYVSPFWLQHLFAYLPYTPARDRAPWETISRELNEKVYDAMQRGTFTATGREYRRLARR
jgi:hypothetical protein